MGNSVFSLSLVSTTLTISILVWHITLCVFEKMWNYSFKFSPNLSSCIVFFKMAIKCEVMWPHAIRQDCNIHSFIYPPFPGVCLAIGCPLAMLGYYCNGSHPHCIVHCCTACSLQFHARIVIQPPIDYTVLSLSKPPMTHDANQAFTVGTFVFSRTF